ncbi:uncharacterized protein LOC111003715 isoform X2 [Pieris rapae]|uniref:uncharacterized protein LOC111003715 isoform X2 n=1 Tax=Pieris rapae TaxID=64459 RepID=UPI001E27B6A7|nr:uncharacterized protein LOC111003715 isoform X2 [Pieris rapae]
MVMCFWVFLNLCALWWAGASARSLDPSACAARFDVQRDKIIRTEESREMGARYLAELDVGARPECLRLCCETDSCDVFVFEEKSPGSCYLFACGPPEDFRCKFTAHGNFSSGVLAISRRLAELQDQERLAPLRHQLADLSRGRSTSTTPTPPLAPHPPPRPTPSHSSPRVAATSTHCSRYQFACATGGECVAVYNACDGVPQCADGSDEAPELACPQAPGPPVPATTAAPPPTLTQVRLESEVDTGGDLSVAEAAAVADAAELWPHRLTQAQPQHHYNDAVPAPVTGDAATGPHIFSHTGGLVQQLGEPAAPGLSWARHSWPQPHRAEPEWPPQQPAAPPGYWPDTERIWSPHRLPPASAQRVMEQRDSAMDNTMPELPLIYGGDRGAVLRDSPKKGFELMAAADRVPYTPPPSLPPRAMVPNAVMQPNAPHPQQTIPIEHSPTPLENTTKKKVLKDIQPELDNTIAAANQNGKLAVPTEQERSKQVKQRAPTEQHGDIGRVDMGQHEHWASDEHEGLSEHPPAALMLLVLGTLLTAALGALAGCRLRAASRRRRHHKRYALDADYLVNGMYL